MFSATADCALHARCHDVRDCETRKIRLQATLEFHSRTARPSFLSLHTETWNGSTARMLVSCTSGWAAGSARLLTRRGKEPSCRQDDHHGDSFRIEAAALPTAARVMAMSRTATQSILLLAYYINIYISSWIKADGDPRSPASTSRIVHRKANIPS